MATLQELTSLIMKQAKEKGFGTTLKDINVGEKFALIHTEISEAYEAYRCNKLRSTGENLGDAVQRILHLSALLNIDIEKAILDKIEFNKSRKWNWDKLNEKHA